MTPSTRQNGAVHIMFLIVVLLVAMVGWFLWFSEFKENEKLKASATSATEDKDVSDYKYQQLRGAFSQLATAVGGVPTEAPEPQGLGFDDIDAIEAFNGKIQDDYVAPLQKKVKECKAFFDGDAKNDKVFEVNIAAEKKVSDLETKITALDAQVATLKGEKSSAENANDTMISNHNGALAAKNAAIEQLRLKNAAKEQQIEGQKDKLAQDLASTTDTYEAALASHTTTMNAVRDANATLDREVRDIKTTLRVKRERNKPDGQITDVNYRAATCYVNIGNRHGLRRGARFRVYGFDKGRVKAWRGTIVVRDTERDRSLCAIEGGAAPRRNDYVTSPHFHTDATKTFFFLGKLPGRFNNQRAKAILEEYDMNVEEVFSVRADFIVLGENPELPEDGEEADPNWFKKTQAYTDAIRWGIEMLRASDLEEFLKY